MLSLKRIDIFYKAKIIFITENMPCRVHISKKILPANFFVCSLNKTSI